MNKLKYLKIFIFLFIMFFTPQVFASDYNVTNKIKNSTSGSSGKYQGTEIYNSGSNNIYSTGTRYDGRLSRIQFYLSADDWDWHYNTTYTITLNMATQDWRNHFMGPQVYGAQSNGTTSGSNLYVSNTFQFVSMYKIKFNFRVGSTMSPYLYFNIYSTSISSTAFTGVSNWNLSSIIITDNTSSSGGSSGGSSGSTPTPTPTPVPSGATNQDIINSNNNNTNSIINNQNNNTQSIIDNNTSNTTDIIDNANQNTEIINNSLNSNCKNGPTQYNNDYAQRIGYLNEDGTITNNLSWVISKFLVIERNTQYHIHFSNQGTSPSLCFYKSRSFDSTSLISCIKYNYRLEFDFTTPNQASFMAISYGGVNSFELTGPVCNDWESEKQDETNKKLDELNNNITSEATPSIDVNIDTASDTPIIDLIYMPLTLIGAILDNSDNTCSPYVLPFDFSGGNNTLTLPCIDLHSLLGNDFYNILNAIICFYMVYNIGLMCVTIYNDLTTLRDGFRYIYNSNDPDFLGYGKEGDE